MASVDGSKSIQADSDNLFDQVWGPCKTGGNEKEAKIYCSDCSEYLCDPCVNYHRTLALTKNHKVVPKNAYLSVRLDPLPFIADVTRSKKSTSIVRNTMTLFVARAKVSNTTNVKHTLFTRKVLSSSQQRWIQFYQQQSHWKINNTGWNSEDKKELKESKEICQKEIKAFRKELDDFLDKLEQNMLAELDQIETKKRQRIDQHITTLPTVLQILDADYQLLHDARKDARSQVMFAAEVKASRGFHKCQNRLDDLEKEVVKLNLSFKRNKQFDDLKRHKAFRFIENVRECRCTE